MPVEPGKGESPLERLEVMKRHLELLEEDLEQLREDLKGHD